MKFNYIPEKEKTIISTTFYDRIMSWLWYPVLDVLLIVVLLSFLALKTLIFFRTGGLETPMVLSHWELVCQFIINAMVTPTIMVMVAITGHVVNTFFKFYSDLTKPGNQDEDVSQPRPFIPELEKEKLQNGMKDLLKEKQVEAKSPTLPAESFQAKLFISGKIKDENNGHVVDLSFLTLVGCPFFDELGRQVGSIASYNENTGSIIVMYHISNKEFIDNLRAKLNGTPAFRIGFNGMPSYLKLEGEKGKEKANLSSADVDFTDHNNANKKNDDILANNGMPPVLNPVIHEQSK